MITLIGTGAGQCNLTREAEEALKNASAIVLQTERCQLAKALAEQGVPYETADKLYVESEDFDELNGRIASMLAEKGDAVYAVLGAPQELEVTAVIAGACAKAGVEFRVCPAVSQADGILAVCAPYEVTASAQRLFAHDVEGKRLDTSRPLAVSEMDTPYVASSVKLALMEYYPDEWGVYIYDGEKLDRIQLCGLDARSFYDHRTCAFIPALPFESKTRYGFGDLISILARLRAPGGCPWDAKQTLVSMRPSLLEEAYEAAEAIDLGDGSKLCEELGDLLMVALSCGLIAYDHGEFSLMDMTTDICAKLIYRHPHVFGQARADTPQEVLDKWEQLKRTEKGQQTTGEAMRAVCRALPALVRSQKVQKKASAAGFDWEEARPALDKVREEAGEVEAELATGGEALELELGDLLFAAVNVCRLSNVSAERALEKACDKFTARFLAMERLAGERGMKVDNLDIQALDSLWQETKSALNRA